MKVNCPSCGRFMKFVGTEPHPNISEEIYERYECECGMVDHVVNEK